ncbi:MAG TPA: hypothetical protein VMD97_13870 [Candidatus Aquilonibacter sp.]|nr:hypothetical protein [Candidatus Aquilonibacter sp.]
MTLRLPAWWEQTQNAHPNRLFEARSPMIPLLRDAGSMWIEQSQWPKVLRAPSHTWTMESAVEWQEYAVAFDDIRMHRTAVTLTLHSPKYTSLCVDVPMMLTARSMQCAVLGTGVSTDYVGGSRDEADYKSMLESLQ